MTVSRDLGKSWSWWSWILNLSRLIKENHGRLKASLLITGHSMWKSESTSPNFKHRLQVTEEFPASTLAGVRVYFVFTLFMVLARKRYFDINWISFASLFVVPRITIKNLMSIVMNSWMNWRKLIWIKLTQRRRFGFWFLTFHQSISFKK